MENHTRWIKADERLPEKGVQVLVWHHDGPAAFGIAFIGEHGGWTSQAGGDTPPAYWMPLPQPPGTAFSRGGEGICGEVVGGRLMLDIDEEPEAVARMMQHFIAATQRWSAARRIS